MAVSHTEPVVNTIISSSGFGIPVSRRIIDTGPSASRPASPAGGTVGAYYFATDGTQALSVWNGAAWIVESEQWQSWTPVILGWYVAGGYSYSFGVTGFAEAPCLGLR